MDTLPPEILKLWGRSVPVSVLDQYTAAALSGVIACPSILEECRTEAMMKGRHIQQVIGTTALSLALGALQARLDLWPEPKPQTKPE